MGLTAESFTYFSPLRPTALTSTEEADAHAIGAIKAGKKPSWPVGLQRVRYRAIASTLLLKT